MSTRRDLYCLDANVLIEAWQKYYSPRICQDYWELLNQLGQDGKIFIPQAVFDEIDRTEDDLKDWLVSSKIPIYSITEGVAARLKSIYVVNSDHQRLVDSVRNRSLADPWVIAHAMESNATVVTKEEKAPTNSNRIKIPNVCDNMGIRCIDDFTLVHELGFNFSCKLGT